MNKSVWISNMTILQPFLINMPDEEYNREFDSFGPYGPFGPIVINKEHNILESLMFGYNKNKILMEVYSNKNINEKKKSKKSKKYKKIKKGNIFWRMPKLLKNKYNFHQENDKIFKTKKHVIKNYLHPLIKDLENKKKSYDDVKINIINDMINDMKNLNQSANNMINYINLSKEQLIDINIKLPKVDNKKILEHELVDIIKSNQKKIFITGDEIHYKSYEPLSTLSNNLKNIINKKNISEIMDILENKIKIWFNSIREAKPNETYFAIKNICKFSNSSLITSNFDMLHEKSGIIPIKINKKISKNLDDDLISNIDQIDYVICIGYIIDAGNLLKLIKKYNKNINFIIINSFKPSYIRKNDIFIQKNIIDFLPILEKLINNK